jgi:hypothetical protein
MKNRCCNPKDVFYGAKGMTICDEWLKNPASFVTWAKSNGFVSGCHIHRKDSKVGYFPDNCEFLSPEKHRSKHSGMRPSTIAKYVKLAVILFLLLFAYPAQAEYKFADNWTTKDSIYQTAAVTLMGADWAQTHWMAKQNWQWNGKNHEEINFFLGKHPSTKDVDTYFPVVIIAHTIIAMALPDKAKVFKHEINPRRIWQCVWMGLEGYQDVSNFSAGARMEF